MKSFTLFIAALFLLVYSFSYSQTADEIIEKCKKNTGVSQAKDLKSWTIKAQQFIPQMNANLPITAHFKAPDKYRLDIEQMGMKMTLAAVGDSAWGFNPMAGSKEPLPKENISQIKQIGELFNNPVSDVKDQFKSYELIGKDSVNGKSAYKVKFITKENDSLYFYFDAITYFIEKADAAGSEIYFKNKAKLNGMVYAKNIEIIQGGQLITKIEFLEVTANPKLEDSLFTTP